METIEDGKKDFNKVVENQLLAMMYSGAYHSEIILEDKGYTLNLVISKTEEKDED